MEDFTQGRLLEAADAVAFMQAGNATLTLVSKPTGSRYTYHIRSKPDRSGRPAIWFVRVMFGPDNETDFAYLGFIKPNQIYHWAYGKTPIKEDDKRNRAFAWAWRALAAGRMPDDLEIWHEGRCGRCGRKLTVPESIASGIGPECAAHL